MRCFLGISNSFEEISCLSYSIFFFYFFALTIEKGFFFLSLLFFGTLHSDRYIFPFLLCLSFLFFSQLFVSLLQTTILPFCIFFPLGDGLITVSCTMLQTSVHSSSDILSIRPNHLNLFVTSTL